MNYKNIISVLVILVLFFASIEAQELTEHATSIHEVELHPELEAHQLYQSQHTESTTYHNYHDSEETGVEENKPEEEELDDGFAHGITFDFDATTNEDEKVQNDAIVNTVNAAKEEIVRVQQKEEASKIPLKKVEKKIFKEQQEKPKKFVKKIEKIVKAATATTARKSTHEDKKEDVVIREESKACKEYSYVRPCGYFTFLKSIFKSCQPVRVCSKSFGSL